MVDDAEFARQKLAGALRSEGYQVLEADNGLSAIHLFERERPAVVFLNVQLPLLDVVTTLRAMRRVNHEAKVVAVGETAESAVLFTTLKAGAVDFILKPLTTNRALTTVIKLVGKA